MASAPAVPVAAEVRSGFSVVLGPPPPETRYSHSKLLKLVIHHEVKIGIFAYITRFVPITEYYRGDAKKPLHLTQLALKH